MGLSNEELLKAIRHYQESLDKYSSNKNNYKLLSVIEKLKRLPIATSHLEDTGIGRTVNALRKLGGDVGDAAKGLVAKWKEMVVEEEEKTKQEESAIHTQSAENDINNCEENYEEISDEIKDKGNESSSSHISSDTEKKSSDKYRKDLDKHKSSRQSSSEKKDKHRDKDRDRDSSSKKRKGEHDSKNERHKSKKRHKSTSSESEEEEEYEEKHEKKSRRRHRSDSSEEDEEEDRNYKSKKSKYSNSSDSEDSYKEPKSKSSKSSKDHRSSSKSKSSEKTERKKGDYDSHSSREEKTKSKHKSESKSKRDSDCEDSKSSSKHKSKSESKSSETEERYKSKHESKSRHEKESSKSKEFKSHSVKHEQKDKKESRSTESKEKHNHKKDDGRRHEEKHKKSKDERENGGREKDSNPHASKAEESSKNSSSSSKHKSGSEKKKDKEKLSTPIASEKIVNGIDSGSGASFADALGMCEPVMPSKSSGSKKKKSASLPSSEKPRASSSYAKPERERERVEEEEDDIVPNLLKQGPPEPLNINISSLLPEISPHYKPMGLPIDSQPRRMLTPDEALSQAISNKNMRTKVYSGNKSYGKVESLFDLCVRILQDNIDALEYTGGVPYSILKPVLERATPDQLFNMEHHNPYLIEDTDELWQLHCQKEFRTKKREELESWREMYMRCLDEREARLNAITATIKQSQDKSTPVRTTKLAYVDSVVKPPRNILRKQAKNGIIVDKRPAQTPASRLSALATSGEAGKVAVPNPGSRAVERSSSSSTNAAAMKPKKAPLMAKTLSLFKNRFRR